MAEHITGSPWEWDSDQGDEAIRMVGTELSRQIADGGHPDLSAAIRTVATRIADGESDPGELGRELESWVGEEIPGRTRSLVTMSWQSDHPGGGSLASLDAIEFDAGVFGVTLWDESEESTEILAMTDSLTSQTVRDQSVNFLASGMIPDQLSVPEMLGRADVAQILESVLGSDSQPYPGWPDLAIQMKWSRPLDSDTDRAELLNAYLDSALRIG